MLAAKQRVASVSRPRARIKSNTTRCRWHFRAGQANSHGMGREAGRPTASGTAAVADRRPNMEGGTCCQQRPQHRDGRRSFAAFCLRLFFSSRSRRGAQLHNNEGRKRVAAPLLAAAASHPPSGTAVPLRAPLSLDCPLPRFAYLHRVIPTARCRPQRLKVIQRRGPQATVMFAGRRQHRRCTAGHAIALC